MSSEMFTWTLQLSQGAILVVLGLGVRGVVGIWGEMRKMNGRMVTLETWSKEHEKRDVERFHDMEKGLDRIDRAIGRPR